jgi:hypothetical protein
MAFHISELPMKRVVVIAAFVLVVLAAFAGGAYMIFTAEKTEPRRPAVSSARDVSDDAFRDDSTPLRAPEKQDPQPDTPPVSADDPAPPPDTRTPPDPTPPPDKPPVRTEDKTRDADTTRVNPDGTEVREVPAAAEAEVTVSGRVTDDMGSPVANAAIMLNHTAPQGGTGRRGRDAGLMRFVAVSNTDDNGFYSATVKLTFPGPSTAMSVSAHAVLNSRLRSPELALEVEPGGTYDGVDFEIPRGASIRGRVVNHRLEPLAGAKVMLQLTEGKTEALNATADEHGEFAIHGIGPGEYRLIPAAEAYQPDGDLPIVTVNSGEELELASDLRLKPMTALKLRLTSDGGQPSGRFTAVFRNADGKETRASGSADGDGNVLLAGVPHDAIELVIEMAGYEKTLPVVVSVVPDDHTDIGEITLNRPAGD